MASVATDPDGDALLYSVVGALPAGARLDPTTGRFDWTPGYGQAGVHTVQLRTVDRSGAADVLAIEIDVADTNRAPALTVSDHRATIGARLSASTVASVSYTHLTLPTN